LVTQDKTHMVIEPYHKVILAVDLMVTSGISIKEIL
jgi:hypothetical protein